MRGVWVGTGDNLRSRKDGVTWYDTGTLLTSRSKVDLVGFTVTDDPDTRTLTITAPASTPSVTVRKNTGADVGTRPRLNFIEGAGITITAADDGGSNEIDLTIATTVTDTDTWANDYYAENCWGRRSPFGSAATSFSGVGLLDTAALQAVTSPGTASRINDSNGIWVQAATGTGAAPVDCGMTVFSVANGAARRELLFIYETTVRLPVVTGAFNVWIGFTSATAGVSSPQAGVNPNTLSCIGFRFFPSLGSPDTTWWCVSGAGDSVNGQSTDSGVTVSANTVYVLKIDCSQSGHIKYSINGSQVLDYSTTSNMPAAATDMGLITTLRRTTGTTNRAIDLRGDNLRYTLHTR